MMWLKTRAVRLWKWFCRDWKRFMILPAIIGGLAAVGRLAWGRLVPSPDKPGPVGTLTPEQGDDELKKIDKAESEAHKAEDESLKQEFNDIDEAFK